MEDELWRWIDARMAPGADRPALDREIWDRFGDELAVVFTDLSGFSRGVAAFGILHFLQVIRTQRRTLEPVVTGWGGRILKQEADSLLMVFPRPQAAIRAAFDMHEATRAHDRDRPPEEWLPLCVGVGFGRVLRVGDHDVYGAEVNAASKLGEDLARAGEVLATGAAFDAAAADLPDLRFSPLDEPVPGTDRAFRVTRPA